MTHKQYAALLPLYVSLLAVGLLHINSTDSWQDPSTLAGIGVGMALVFGAWIYGRRRHNRTHGTTAASTDPRPES